MGWAEARWMSSHWQGLEVVEFFEQGEEPTEPSLWPKEQYIDRLMTFVPSKAFV